MSEAPDESERLAIAYKTLSHLLEVGPLYYPDLRYPDIMDNMIYQGLISRVVLNMKEDYVVATNLAAEIYKAMYPNLDKTLATTLKDAQNNRILYEVMIKASSNGLKH